MRNKMRLNHQSMRTGQALSVIQKHRKGDLGGETIRVPRKMKKQTQILCNKIGGTHLWSRKSQI